MSTASAIDADLIIIGFGKGGKTLAATLGRQGWRVVMVEQSAQMYGGTCINIGCVPTKSLVYGSEHLGSSPHPHAYRSAVERTQQLTAGLRAENFAMLDTIDSVTVLTGEGRFVNETTVEVKTSDDTTTVTGRHIVIGTGSAPVFPDIPGLEGNRHVVSSTDLLASPELPTRLVVLGGGYVGLEFAAMYRAYGSAVTVLERHSSILGREDDDVAGCALSILRDTGVQLVTDAEVTGVAEGRVEYTTGGTHHSIEGDRILVALGRRPVTAGLDLPSAGVRTRPDGSIEVDEYLRTSQSHIFAVGDVNGGPQFTYVSLDDYRIVVDQLTGAAARTTKDRRAIPNVLFTTPPLARVGVTEREARADGRHVRVASLPVEKMATVPRARIVGDVRGMMKVVVDANTDEILGAALLSHDSHEVINIVALAIRHSITATEMRDSIYTHPSMTEAFNQLLGALS